MPLPENNAGQWPPPDLLQVHDRYQSWAAWLSGDPEELAQVYGGPSAAQRTGSPSVRNRPSQYRGGVVGSLSRWFWGAPLPASGRRTKLHVPLPADIATLSADLLFGTPPTFKAADKTTQDRLEKLIDDGVHTRLREGAEEAAALGGVYLRVVWDEEVSDRPWLSTSPPDCAVPEWRWDQLAAVTFWRVLAENGQQMIRHLERHESGRIVHALYEGTATEIGRRIPLTEHPDTLPLKDVLTEGDAIETGIKELTSSYVPNVRPNRIWRHVPAARNLGRSDFSGLEAAFDSIDEIWSSLMRDYRQARSRLIVPQSFLETAGRGQGATFDMDEELFVGVNQMPGQGGDEITQNQFKIRVTEHLDGAGALTEAAIRGAGYSTQSLGIEGEGGMVTATEVDAKEGRSDKTRARKITYWRPGLGSTVFALLAIDRNRFGTKVVPQIVDIDWPTEVDEDALTTAQTTTMLRTARLMSQRTAIARNNRDWSEDEVNEEIAEIASELTLTQASAAQQDSIPDPTGPDAPTD